MCIGRGGETGRRERDEKREKGRGRTGQGRAGQGRAGQGRGRRAKGAGGRNRTQATRNKKRPEKLPRDAGAGVVPHHHRINI